MRLAYWSCASAHPAARLASLALTWCCSWIATTNCAQIDIRLGGIFESKNSDEALMFKYAINKANKDMPPGYSLSFDIQEISDDDSFSVSKIVCTQMRSGVAAIFGPTNPTLSDYVNSACNTFHVPHIQLHPYRLDSGDEDELADRLDFTLRLSPTHGILSTALTDYIQSLKWNSFTIIYERSEALSQLQEIFSFPERNPRIILYKLITTKPGDYTTSLKDLQKSVQLRPTAHSRPFYVLHCDHENVVTILKQATEVQLLSEYSHILLTGLNAGSIDVRQLPINKGNLTVFQLVNTSSPLSTAVLQEFHQKHMPDITRNITTEAALVYDGVQIFVNAFKALLVAQDIQVSPLSCNSPSPWQYGESLLNYMRVTTFNGLTGSLSLDFRGARSNIKLMVLELTSHSIWRKIGTWTPTHRLSISKQFSVSMNEAAEALKGRMLRVTTIIEAPYVMLNGTDLQGNHQFKGFCIDLLNEIAKKLEFEYEISLVADTQYGAEINGTWNGMVGELVNWKADLAVASLTITSQREDVISFTMPFMNLGISILYKKEPPRPAEPFSFHKPLSHEIWMYTITAYAAVTCLIFLLSRFSPYEWMRTRRCATSTEENNILENQFGISNSMWFTIGSLMQQGSDVCPKAASTRIASASWWFFTLILVASYTANLAAFLTIDRMALPITSAEDLVKEKSRIKFGTRANGSTMSFFQKSQVTTYKQMWDAMKENRSVFVSSTEEGIKKVKGGNYAYLLESTQIEYITQRDCDLIGVGGQLDSKHYAFGTPQNSPFRDLISQVILKLKEDQVLEKLKEDWWKKDGIITKCPEVEKEKSNAHALQLQNVAGIFFILIGGILLAFITAGFEYMLHSNQSRNKSSCSQFCNDFTFGIRHPGTRYKQACEQGHHEGSCEPEEVQLNHIHT